ncbi:MAG: cell division protein ZapE [Pseudomonadota bacterium]
MELTGGPRQRYDALLAAGEIDADPGQALAIEALQGVFDRILRRREAVQRRSLWQRLLDREPARVTGLYMWGGVGRGKTFLMDLFFAALPFEDKQRMHFHRFMREVHQGLTDHAGTPNPLRRVASDMAERGGVLCFDEFFVSDIGDAMILGELLGHLFEFGVVLIATSNVVPDRLYENGLQRRRFLPAIQLLNTYTDVLNVDGGTDHRLRVLEQAEIFHSPLGETAEAGLAASFASLVGQEPVVEAPSLRIEGRDIAARATAGDVAWFDFAALCDGPRSANDYIEIARVFHTVVLSDVPRFTARIEDQARRFISLVDEFYDRSVKLILSAEEPVASLYQGDRLSFEFERTASRLLEMRSHDYLAREHRA